MSIIDLLIAPVTDDNIVNNIRLEKKSPIPFASKLLPNSKRRKNYEFKYNNKQFNTILQGSKKVVTDHNIDVKASAQLGWAVDTSNELEFLNFIKNASIYKLRKIKPSQYSGVRIGNVNSEKEWTIYNFTERWYAPFTFYDETEKIYRYDRNNIQAMIDPALFRSVFNDKHSYPPILPSSLEGAEETGYEIETPGEISNKLVPALKQNFNFDDDEKEKEEKEEEEEKEEKEKEKELHILTTPSHARNNRIVRTPGIVRSPSESFQIPQSEIEEIHEEENVSTQRFSKAFVSGYLKSKRNKIIRNILLEYSITPPKRIRDTYVDSIFDGTSNVDPAACEKIKKELKRQNLNF